MVFLVDCRSWNGHHCFRPFYSQPVWFILFVGPAGIDYSVGGFRRPCQPWTVSSPHEIGRARASSRSNLWELCYSKRRPYGGGRLLFRHHRCGDRNKQCYPNIWTLDALHHPKRNQHLHLCIPSTELEVNKSAKSYRTHMLKRLFTSLTRPHYLFRPQQIIRRLWRQINSPNDPLQEIILPWGLPLRININDHIGRSIWLHGLYDFLVCEALWRLTRPDTLAVDVGANIGQMTSILALRTGPTGHVLAFEPHPDIYEHLQFNTDRLSNCERTATIEPADTALSNYSGAARLAWNEEFEGNKGIAHLTSNPNHGIEVTCNTLDKILSRRRVSVLKLDVEGHELSVIKGGINSIKSGTISNIIYECHCSTPPDIHEYLKTLGLSIFRLDWDGSGPSVSFPIIWPSQK